MFDNSKPNVILFSDYTDVIFMNKTIGAHKIACEMRNAGFEVLVLSHLHVFSVAEIIQILKSAVNENTLFVGVSSFFYLNTSNPATREDGGIQFHPKELGAFIPQGLVHNKELKNVIKGINPKCKMVLGGHDAKDASYAKDFDYVVIGYADLSAVNLAKHLAYGEKLNHSQKSVFGPIVINDAKADGYDFVATPMRYTECDIIMPGETLGIEISRGCIFKCAYCTYPLNGKKKNDYIKLEEILTNEFLENYEKYGITRYTFSDDTFNDSRDKIEMIHRISKSLPFQLEYWAYIRADLMAAHPDTVDLLFESGLRVAHMGIETMHPETASIIGKGGNRQKLIDIIDYIKTKYGDEISLTGSFIFGLPREPMESMMRTSQMLIDKTIRLDTTSLAGLRIWPNHTFQSEIDINYEKYGYKITGQSAQSLVWENEHTNYFEACKIATDTEEKGNSNGNRKVGGRAAFYIASLGFDLKFALNQQMREFNWHAVDLQKKKRVIEYKQKVCDVLNIKNLEA